MPDSQIGRNAVFAVGQGLVSLVCLFTAYRIVAAKAGIEAVGLWSLLVAGSFMARAADVSGVGALSRFVGEKKAKHDNKRLATYIHTVLLTTIIFNLAIGGLLYLFAPVLIARFVEAQFVAEAIRVVPYAIISVVLLAPVGIGVTSAVDGLNRADQRAVIVGVSAIVLVVATWYFVPEFGIVGFGIAQICQQGMIILSAWVLLRSHVPEVGLVPWRWEWPVFVETTTFGLKLQLNALASVMSEPLAKFLLSSWGGLAAVGYYEFAARLVFQAKGFIVAATHPLIANFAEISPAESARLENLLEKSTRLVLKAAVGVVLATVLIAPLVSMLVFGDVRSDLLLMVCAIAFGSGLNVMSVTFYFAALAKGVMRWNILSQAQMALVVVMFGLLLGPIFGGSGVIAAIVIGLAMGSIVIFVGNSVSLKVTPVVRSLRVPVVIAVVLLAAVTGGGAATVMLLLP